MLLNLPISLLLVLSILANLAGGILRNQYSKKYEANDRDLWLFLLIGQIGGFATLLVTSAAFSVSLFTALAAVAFGGVCIAAFALMNKALKIGPMGIFNIIITSSMLIPALSGPIGWGEKLTLPTVAGIAGMLLMILLVTARHQDKKAESGRFWVYCFIAVLLSGAVGILQKVHQTSSHREEIDTFLLIAFSVTILFAAAFWLRERSKQTPALVSFSFARAPFWLALCCGVCTSLPHRINLFLSGVMDSAVFFPLVNGCGLLLSVLAAVLLYKERLTARQTAGVLVGMAAILLLSGIV